MNSQNLIAKISQSILDANHPGSQSSQVIQQLCPGLLGNSRSVIELFAHWLNDCLGQTDLGHRDHNPKAAIRLNSMLEELCFRFIDKGHNQSLATRFLEHASTAQRWQRGYETLKQHAYRLEKNGANPFIMNEIKRLSEQCKALDYPVYLLAKAEITIKGSVGKKTRERFYPSPPVRASGIRFPLSEETRQRLEREQVYLDSASIKDLSTRIVHSIRRHDLAKYDPQYPVYGVESIYALIPWMISQCHGTAQELARPLENPEALSIMQEQIAALEALNQRAERLVTPKPNYDEYERC